MIPIVLALLASLPCQPRSSAREDPFERFALPNGLAVEVWTSVEAQRAAAFVFLPEGLLDDDAGEMQWAHLLEHALIRSSEPDDLQKGSISLNGETMGGVTRLETLGPPEELGSMLAMLADWLDNRSFSPALIEREAGRIEEEIATTTAGGHTHKSALAALGQVARHGAGEVRLRGVLAAAEPERLERLAVRRAGTLADLRVVIVGPSTLEEVQTALAATLAKLAPEKSEKAHPKRSPRALPDLLRVAWDLERSHYLEWYALSTRESSDPLAHELLARLVTQACYLSPSPLLRGGRALATIEEVREGERALLLSLDESAGPLELEQARAALRSVLDPFAPDGKAWRDASAMLPMLKQQLVQLPDLGALRRQWQGRLGVELLEANIALALAHLERGTGLTLTELERSAPAIDTAHLREVAKGLALEQRHGLLLHPRKD